MKKNTNGNRNPVFSLASILIVISMITSMCENGVGKFLSRNGADGFISLMVLILVCAGSIGSLLKYVFPGIDNMFSGGNNREKYGSFPHFGKELDIERVTEIIESSDFSEYKTRYGEKLKSVTISDDEKWFCILDGFMPLDLVCGYNAKKNVLLAIDGSEIKLPLKAKLPHISKDIDEFFKDRGIYYKSLPKKADDIYYKARKTFGLNIDRENFSRVRYLWEKKVVNEENFYWISDDSDKICRIFRDKGVEAPIHDMVLSDSDIEEIAKCVNDNRVSLSRYINFEDYSNEFSVCNGIELLAKLEYPSNAEGIDFLFRCIGDVDEAYFTYAVELLEKYPRDLVEEKIEENMRSSFEREDVVNIAGIMYLAKDIGYEIKYTRSLRKMQKGDPIEGAICG